MDFSYLDKKSYKDIRLYNNSIIGGNDEGNRLFFIRKYKVDDMMLITHRHTYIQINYVINGSGYHYINNGKTVICRYLEKEIKRIWEMLCRMLVIC